MAGKRWILLSLVHHVVLHGLSGTLLMWKISLIFLELSTSD